MTIPKVLHQTYSKNFDQLPLDIIKNIDALKAENADFSYMYYSDIDRIQFIKSNYEPDYLERYLKISSQYGAARADYFRYLLMYKVGGVYIDIKSTLKKKLSDIIKPSDQYLLIEGHYGNSTINQWDHIQFQVKKEWCQWQIICRPNHPFLKNVIDIVNYNIDNYNPITDGVGKFGVLKTTGPIPYTHGINSEITKHEHRVLDSRDSGLKYSIYEGNSHSKVIRNYRDMNSPIINNNHFINFIYPLFQAKNILKKKFRK